MKLFIKHYEEEFSPRIYGLVEVKTPVWVAEIKQVKSISTPPIDSELAFFLLINQKVTFFPLYFEVGQALTIGESCRSRAKFRTLDRLLHFFQT